VPAQYCLEIDQAVELATIRIVASGTETALPLPLSPNNTAQQHQNFATNICQRQLLNSEYLLRSPLVGRHRPVNIAPRQGGHYEKTAGDYAYGEGFFIVTNAGVPQEYFLVMGDRPSRGSTLGVRFSP